MDIYKSFDKPSNKRDLSDKSSNGEDPKKQRVGSLDKQKSPDEVWFSWPCGCSLQLHAKYREKARHTWLQTWSYISELD